MFRLKNRFINAVSRQKTLVTKTVEGKKYTIENPWVKIFQSGVIKLTDGNSVKFNEENKKDIFNFVYFLLAEGIRLGDEPGQWKLLNNNIIQTHQGLKLYLQNFDPLIFSETFLRQIHFSSHDLANKIVVTAGAFIGDTPLYYAYFGAKVYAFEPDTKSFALAKQNIKLNQKLANKIVLKRYAIGRDGKVDFPSSKSSGGSSLFNKTNAYITTPSKSIKTLLKEMNIHHPYLLDLDIKGSEFDVINDKAVSRFKLVRLEYSPYLLKDKSKTLKYLLDKLKDYGFKNVIIFKHNQLRFDLSSHGTIYASK